MSIDYREPLWLIRTARNEISLPTPETDLKKLIISGKLTHRDEVCRANGYWFFLHESDEVQKHLGIEISPELLTIPNTDDDLTATEIEKSLPSQPSIPDLQPILSKPDDPVRNRALLEFQNTHIEETKPSQPFRPQIMGKLANLERASLWKTAIVLLLFVIAGLLVAILRVIRI